jgi:hypothetical protein
MLKDLEEVLDRVPESEDPDEVAQDIRQAVRFLLERQFLYGEDIHSGTKIATIRQHRAYVRNLFDAFGYRLVINDEEGFVGYVPSDEAQARRMKLDETLFMIALRILYEDRVENASIKAGGRAEVLLSEVWALVEERTRRQRPTIVRSREILQIFQRHGIVKPIEDLPDNNMTMDIRPCIREVCTEKTVDGLLRFVRGRAAAIAQEVAEDGGLEESHVEAETGVDEDGDGR